MEKLLREWRQDAINKHQYESAIYIGDKLLALTNDSKDAFWLAQVHFSTGNYTRALSFLTRHNLLEHSPACRYLAAHCHIKQSKFEEALQILGDKNPTHLVSSSSKVRRKLQHTSGALRNGIGKSGKAQARSDRIERSEERDREDLSDIKFEAAMCFLRGICFAKQNAFDKAKECYMDAVKIDVQCFEAFDQLMKNSLMSPNEEWEFLESLDFDSIPATDASTSQEAAQFVRMLYTTRLSKYKNPKEFIEATETLSTHYRLADNHDLLLAKADLLFTQCRFKEALQITSSVLDSDSYNFAIYPLHLACLHELGQKNALFLVSHRLADLHPDEPVTWLAVGVYYLSIGKVAEARRFFSKSSMMDPHFGPAWIGFAHTFAEEGEHDQAISAYSTAARLFQGTHLPNLFLGMQNLQLNNLGLAQEYLTAAQNLCSSDPLLLNELGVVYYNLDHLDRAVYCFTSALELASQVEGDPKSWIPTRANLGHAYRRQRNWDLALAQFDEVLRLGGRDCLTFCSRGLILLETGKVWEAVCAFHEALGVQAQDPIATDLLNKALEEMSEQSVLGGGRVEELGAEESFGSGSALSGPSEEVEEMIRRRKEAAKDSIARGRLRRQRALAMDDSVLSGLSEGKGKGKGRASMGTELGDESMMDMSDDDGV